MKILDFDLEGSHFIIEADIAPRQEADDDMECQWLRYDFDNTQVYKETDGAVSPFQITAVAWAGYQLTADHALKDVIGRIPLPVFLTIPSRTTIRSACWNLP